MLQMNDEVSGFETDQVAPGRAGERLRSVLVWAGVVTLAALSVLATLHLIADIDAVLGIRGSRWLVAGRLLPVVLLSGLGLGLALLTSWLAAAGRRRELIAIAIGFATLIAHPGFPLTPVRRWHQWRADGL